MRVSESRSWEWAKVVLFLGAIGILLLSFDAMMRHDQESLCESDQVECPQ